MSAENYNFENIYNEYKNKIYHYLVYLIGESEAEDITQEVFLKINKGLNSFNGKSKISTWVYRIANNSAIDFMRSNKNKKKNDYFSEEDLTNEDKAIKENKKVPTIEKQIIETEMNECIRMQINKLPENYKSVLILSDLEGLKNKEIAEILNLSIDNVKIRLFRARAHLKKILETKCKFYHNEDNQFSCEPK